MEKPWKRCISRVFDDFGTSSALQELQRTTYGLEAVLGHGEAQESLILLAFRPSGFLVSPLIN